MSKLLHITTKENLFQIVVDGNERKDVLSYRLEENIKGVVLNLEIAILGEVEVEIES